MGTELLGQFRARNQLCLVETSEESKLEKSTARKKKRKDENNGKDSIEGKEQCSTAANTATCSFPDVICIAVDVELAVLQLVHVDANRRF